MYNEVTDRFEKEELVINNITTEVIRDKITDEVLITKNNLAEICKRNKIAINSFINKHSDEFQLRTIDLDKQVLINLNLQKGTGKTARTYLLRECLPIITYYLDKDENEIIQSMTNLLQKCRIIFKDDKTAKEIYQKIFAY